jgi:virulence factor Mce-like protein
MQKTAPTFKRLSAMALFALSCFGLLLYLWNAFGGPVPLKPHGYRFTIAFPQASQLAEQADVRISGVPVGRVIRVGLGPNNTAQALVELKRRYAPLPSDSRAMLRQKTILGETYVELTPGSRTAPQLQENGQLGRAQVAPSVALDEIFRAFDEPTRHAFQTWMQASAAGLHGRGEDLNAAFGNLVPFTDDANRLVTVLNGHTDSVRKLVRGTGEVFDALSTRQGQLTGLISSADATFSATAASDRQLADAFRALPGFERSSRRALRDVDTFAAEASPLLDQIQPAIRSMGPAFRSLARTAPDLKGTLQGVGALDRASVKGFPALASALGDLRPLLAQLTPVLHELNPMLSYLAPYHRELDAFVANITAASQGGDANRGAVGKTRYIRTMTPLSLSSLASLPKRYGANRANAYPLPGTLLDPAGRTVLDDSTCSRGNPVIKDTSTDEKSVRIIDLLSALGVTRGGAPGESADVAAGPCIRQGAGTP